MTWLAVALGGAVGALLRFGVGRLLHRVAWVQEPSNLSIPMATLGVNLIGSFVIGAFFAWLLVREEQPLLNAFFATGLLGGFTTFSAFSREVLQMAVDGDPLQALGYVLLGTILPVGGAFAGYMLVR